MNTTQIYPPDIDARAHVFEPLRPVLAAHGKSAGYPNVPHYDLEEVQRDAYERGVVEGKQAVDQDLIRVVHGMVEAVKRWKGEQDSLREAMKQDMLRLSLAIARQVIMCELKSNPDAIAEVVRTLLEEAEGRKVFSVLLHSDDVARIKRSSVAHLLEQSEIALQASDEIAPGGCMFETSFGKLDASLETRIHELSAGLLADDAKARTNAPHADDPESAEKSGKGAMSQ